MIWLTCFFEKGYLSKSAGIKQRKENQIIYNIDLIILSLTQCHRTAISQNTNVRTIRTYERTDES